MTPERWKRIEELYHSADALPTGERAAYLAAACPDDEKVRREVEALLSEPVTDGALLAQPAIIAGAQLFSDASPATNVGRVIAGYRLEALLGAGGMGEVYRARDVKLGRDVAIKILPTAFTDNPDRLARFEREARMLAALNHPGICAIYAVEEVEGIRLLVLELVEGETLGEKLALRLGSGQSGLPLSDALAIARQITEALEVAHDKGIVHRDLKPANIKITPDGVVKVLDFGLAKAVGGDTGAPDLTLAPKATNSGLREGPVIGTAAYMSPEQARGLPVDKRSDVWAFGCTLFEMLTGRVAFAGDTVSDSIAKILEREPDWSALPATTPASIRRLLLRALTKDPKKRLRDISDVRIEIDAIDEALPGATDASQRSTRVVHRRTWLPWSAALVLGMGLAAAAAWNLRPLPALTITGFTHTLPPDQVLNGSRGAQIVALSPDGAQLVYSGTPSGLYVRLMSDVNAKLIPGTESFEATGPVFSPDGRSIAFFTITDQTLKKIPVTGGAPQTLCPVDGPPIGMTWGPEGIVFGHGRQGIKKVSPDGGTPEVLVQVNDGEAAHGPQILPGGEHVLFTLAKGTAPLRWDKAHIVVESLKDHQRRLLIEGGSDARYLATGHLVYAIAGGLHAVAFDPQTLELGNERATVIEGVRRAAGSFTGGADFSVSRTGALGYVPGPPMGEFSALDLALMDRSGEVQPLQLPPGPYALPRVSPQGTRVAFQSDDGNEAIIYTHELSGTSTMQRLTTEGNNRFPMWASESRVVFQSDRQGDRAVWWQPLDGPAERLTTPEKGTSHTPESWFDDVLLYSVTKGSDVSLWTLSLPERKTARFDAAPSSATTGAVFSPDGRWVAYASMQRSQVTLYVQKFPTGPRYPFTTMAADTPKQPRWSRDGKELLYNPRGSGLEFVRIVTTEPLTFGKPVAIPKRLQGSPPGSRTPYDLMPDGRLVGIITAGQKELVGGSNTQIQVVLNWHEELKRLVPPR